MWTYDPTNLDKETPEGRKNIVRFLVGDVDTNDPQLQDEEIQFALDTANGKTYGAAISVISAIISRYSRLVNVELDGAIKEDYSDLIKNYQVLQKDLRNRHKFETGGISIIATGLTVDDFKTAEQDSERVAPGIQQFKWRDYPNGIQNDGYISVTSPTR